MPQDAAKKQAAARNNPYSLGYRVANQTDNPDWWPQKGNFQKNGEVGDKGKAKGKGKGKGKGGK